MDNEAYEAKLIEALKALKAMVSNPSFASRGVAFRIEIRDKEDDTITEIYVRKTDDRA